MTCGNFSGFLLAEASAPPTWVEISSMLAGVVQAFAAIVALIIAALQLPPLIRSLRMAGLSALLQFEAELNARKVKMTEQAVEVHRLRGKKKPDEDLLNLQQQVVEALLENYLNAVDRLAYCIIHKELGDRDFKTEYRQHILDDVTNYPHKFGPDTAYKSIRTLYEMWK